jgi:hypothetical protein
LIAFLITGIGESSLGERVSPVFFTILGFIAASTAAPGPLADPAQESPPQRPSRLPSRASGSGSFRVI